MVKRILCVYYRLLLKRKGVSFGHGLFITGRPTVINRGGSIDIGKNVKLSSDMANYIPPMYKSVRFSLIRQDAKITIGDETRIYGASFIAAKSIKIGKDCLIAANTIVLDTDIHGFRIEERHRDEGIALPVVIEDYVWIGLNCIIHKGVRIGKGSVILAGSVVSKDIPDGVVASGNPAKQLKKIDE